MIFDRIFTGFDFDIMKPIWPDHPECEFLDHYDTSAETMRSIVLKYQVRDGAEVTEDILDYTFEGPWFATGMFVKNYDVDGRRLPTLRRVYLNITHPGDVDMLRIYGLEGTII